MAVVSFWVHIPTTREQSSSLHLKQWQEILALGHTTNVSVNTVRCHSADPRPLGALRKTVSGGGENGWDAFVRVSLRLESRSRKALEKQYLFRDSYKLSFFFLSKSKRLDDIHVTWFGWFVRRERDSAPHKNKRSFMFSEPLAKIKNETKIKTSLRARGPPGVSGALRSGCILRIGRIGSGCH